MVSFNTNNTVIFYSKEITDKCFEEECGGYIQTECDVSKKNK